MSFTDLIVLGANSDIGSRLVSLASRQKHMNVLAVSRSKARRGLGDNVTAVGGLDLTRASGLQGLVRTAARFSDRPFAVVHCVGDFWVHKRLVDTSIDEIIEMVSSHFISLCCVAKALTPLMLDRRGGRFIAFSCNSVSFNYPEMSPFTASKAAVEAFVRCLANEYSEHGLSAFVLALPTIRTPKVEREKPNGDFKNYVTSDELAAIVLNNVLTLPNEASGTTVKVFKHSPTFYNMGYFQRNPSGVPTRRRRAKVRGELVSG